MDGVHGVFFVLLLGTANSGEGAGEASRVVSASMFKNGLAVVEREVQLPASEEYVLQDLPEIVHGTLWIDGGKDVEIRTKAKTVGGETAHGDILTISRFAGRTIKVHFREAGQPTLVGKLMMSAEPPKPQIGHSLTLFPNAGPQPFGVQSVGSHFLLETEKGNVLISYSDVLYVESDGMNPREARSEPVFRLVNRSKDARGVRMTYVSRGLSWAPSYHVDVRDPKRLKLGQTAVIRNEMTTLKDTELSLISGFPNIRFSGVGSPIDPRTSWSMFFGQLRGRRSGVEGVQSQVMFNRRAEMAASDVDADNVNTFGDGIDLHEQKIGRRSLEVGESMQLVTAEAEADYERIVLWHIPDRRGQQHSVNRSANFFDAEDEDTDEPPVPWDAVVFKNPLDFPLTTAPATVVAGGRLLGQGMVRWTNPGEQTRLAVNKALSIRASCEEFEESQADMRDPARMVRIANVFYQIMLVRGELKIANQRKEAIAMHVRAELSGSLKEVDEEPTQQSLEQGIFSVNKRLKLEWQLALKPGENKVIRYKYEVLVNR